MLATIKKGYNLNLGATTLDNAIIKCDKDGDINSCKVLNALLGFYINSGIDKITNPLINCASTLCSGYALENIVEGYYVDASTSVTVTANNINET